MDTRLLLSLTDQAPSRARRHDEPLLPSLSLCSWGLDALTITITIVTTHPWSFSARASDLRHLKTRRRKKMVVIQRKRVKPSLQDARRKIPEAPAPRITHRLRMTD